LLDGNRRESAFDDAASRAYPRWAPDRSRDPTVADTRLRVIRTRCSDAPTGPDASVVYARCMSRTNIDIDDDACTIVMKRYRLATKREAVNFALRTLATEPLSLDAARRLRGSGWDGELDELRSTRTG
jgi:Arc/MetJ family transcription regulator